MTCVCTPPTPRKTPQKTDIASGGSGGPRSASWRTAGTATGWWCLAALASSTSSKWPSAAPPKRWPLRTRMPTPTPSPPEPSPITVAVGQFGEVIARGLLEILEGDRALRVVGAGLDHAALQGAVAHREARVVILDEDSALVPAVPKRLRGARS